MRGHEETARILAEWVDKAEHDLLTAVHTLKLGKRTPTETVSFHAQQCVEKYLKALLVLQDVVVPRTHDIEVLLGIVSPRNRPMLNAFEQQQLTEYAADVRYPSVGNPSLAEAREAVALARRVRAQARKILPKAALRRNSS